MKQRWIHNFLSGVSQDGPSEYLRDKSCCPEENLDQEAWGEVENLENHKCDWPTHGPTDMASSRVTCPWLKMAFLFKKQVTRGHNIVADGWAGAYKPHPHPNPPPTLIHTQKESKYPVFNSITMTDRRTDPRTDQRTDKASYRVACPQLKRFQSAFRFEITLSRTASTNNWE